MKTKICSKCKQRKKLQNFSFRKNKYKNKVYISHRSWCRSCRTKDRKEDKQNLFKKQPWTRTYYSIVGRCTRKSRYYYRRGIKNFLKIKDLKYLWFRDKAYLMKKPSINRKSPDKHYTLKNCKYIEYLKNVRDNRGGTKKEALC